MVKFEDGPAQGHELNLRRTPMFLRVVIGDKVDAIDMPEDIPEPNEDVYAYHLIDGTATAGFLCGVKGRGCIPFRSAIYRFCSIQPEENILRDRKLWVKWVEEISV